MICRFCEAQIVNVSGPGEYSKYENRMICRARRVNSMFDRGDASMSSFWAQKDYDAMDDEAEMEYGRG